ncbi:unnamed protein product [Urochloa humidicola]
MTRSQGASSRAHGSRLACVSLVSRRSQPRCRVVASPPPLPPSRRSACHFPLLHPTAHHSPLPRAPRRDKRRLEREGCSAGAPHGPPHARAGRREAGRGRRGEEGWRWAWCSTARSWRWIWLWPGCRWRSRSASSPSSPPFSAPQRSSTTPSPPRRPSRRRPAAAGPTAAAASGVGGASINARAALENLQMQRIVDCTHQVIARGSCTAAYVCFLVLICKLNVCIVDFVILLS